MGKNGLLEKETLLKQKENIKNIKNCFVYFLFKGETIVYVGQTKEGMERIAKHYETKDFDSYAKVFCEQKDLNNTEAKYIVKFTPIYNGCLLPGNDIYGSKDKLKKKYRIDGNAFNRIVNTYGITPHFHNYYKTSEFIESFEQAQKDKIIIYNPSGAVNSDWFINN